MTEISLEQRDGYCVGRFMAMGSPCELLVDGDDRELTFELTRLAFDEAIRIEQKFSRYRVDSIVHAINNSSGRSIEVDDETAKLLDYADLCFRLSEGKFDVTSGVLRKIWTFDGSDRVPAPEQITAMLPHIGWNKAVWEKPRFTLPEGMEIDFGGIGKEYAVDKTALIVAARDSVSTVVNYGGDLYVSGPRRNGETWRIGIDDPRATGERGIGHLRIKRGGIATSGDARRFLFKNGVRYGHILNPKTGWPVRDAPRSVTVAANTCLDAGMLSTFAMLEGANAEEFLKAQGVKYLCYW